MATVISRNAEILTHSMRQECTVYPYLRADRTGQPVYDEGTRWPCRLAIRTERIMSDEGDYISNSTVTVILPASCPVQAYDKIDLPADFQQGAIIREVITATDAWGGITHKAVRIA